MVQSPGHALAGIDVPAWRPLEPAALRDAEASSVSLAYERHLGDDGIRADHFQVEAWLEHVVDEAQLHQRWLEQHAAIFELR